MLVGRRMLLVRPVATVVWGLRSLRMVAVLVVAGLLGWRMVGRRRDRRAPLSLPAATVGISLVPVVVAAADQPALAGRVVLVAMVAPALAGRLERQVLLVERRVVPAATIRRVSASRVLRPARAAVVVAVGRRGRVAGERAATALLVVLW